MKSFRTLIVVLATATLLAAGCRKQETVATDTATTTVAADTSATTATTATTTSTVPPADYQFAVNASNANFAEIQFGTLAAQKAVRPDVKSFGQRMVTDHTAIGNNYAPIANAQGLPIPTTLTPQNQETYDHLSKLSGAAFDDAYVKHMVTDHEAAVGLFDTEANTGQDPQLKAFAASTLPTIEAHLLLAQQLAGQK